MQMHFPSTPAHSVAKTVTSIPLAIPHLVFQCSWVILQKSRTLFPLQAQILICSRLIPLQHFNWQQAQESDAILPPICQAKVAGEKPTGDSVQRMSQEGCQLLELWDQLQVESGILYRCFVNNAGTSRKQLIVPIALRPSILKELRAGTSRGHLGDTKTVACLKV